MLGVVSTIAGSGNVSQVDGVGTAACFRLPGTMKMGSDGSLYVIDRDRVRRISLPDGS